MKQLVITGASRGIGAALARALAPTGCTLVLVARDERALATTRDDVIARGGRAEIVPGDVGSLEGARRLVAALGERLSPGATLVQNAGIWPASRALGPDGLEQAFVTNHLGPLVVQRALLERALLARVLVVSAGLLIKGRFDAARTPSGDDFSAITTYATTKLCFALATRDDAAAHPSVDFLVLHPGVVRTDLGARSGLVGALLSMVKRTWERPETCAARLARIVAREGWSRAGEASWWVLEEPTPWPALCDDEALRASVRETTTRALERGSRPAP
ncbi:SDR family NAD(P)-dependent oxidoreductase [Sandaracinus amylolyticus]|uniref:SDR family NAD(P)-dependent oxidoreductase n=1 Tax=Sandaracinus amylolyticus TaxID=927083 RepID=UPI001F23DCDD|nr:SDR family NAD(P)-dependent oxidoreductase [Sandaracinus amylolyticus]UJR84447.1 Hypothetical protein I5071_65260 [Sandaracinus amylolyticus]